MDALRPRPQPEAIAQRLAYLYQKRHGRQLEEPLEVCREEPVVGDRELAVEGGREEGGY